MLSLRLAIFAALFGIALWGLFALLGNLSEPELLRSEKVILVKGCEPSGSEQARSVCAQLFCQKALLDQRVVPLRAVFKITTDTRSGREHTIGGVVQDQPFTCTLQDGKVIDAQLVHDNP